MLPLAHEANNLILLCDDLAVPWLWQVYNHLWWFKHWYQLLHLCCFSPLCMHAAHKILRVTNTLLILPYHLRKLRSSSIFLLS